MKRILTTLAVSLCASGFLYGAALSAPQFPMSPAGAVGSTFHVEEVATKKVTVKKTTRHGTVTKTRTVKYSRSKYGPRYKARRPGYTYYYGGYYYARPWWGAAVPGAIIVLP